jgi:hypothetical protein
MTDSGEGKGKGRKKSRIAEGKESTTSILLSYSRRQEGTKLSRIAEEVDASISRLT